MPTAYIALGSNIAPRRFFIDSALKKIGREKGTALKKHSSVYDTFPLGGREQARYLNSVAEIETVLRPRELLRRLLRIERSLGRIRTGKDSPRTIDLDLLLYDDLVMHDENISIPHPRMHKRDFVLSGMREISPQVRHPVLGASIDEIYGRRRMKVIQKPTSAYRYVSSLKRPGRRVGFVPTMGYLHEGHLSLIKQARRENDIVVLSIFVNPLQFGPREDYKNYPRNFKRDKKLAKKNGVDIIFAPHADDLYATGHCSYVDVERLSQNLCGRFRRGHFRGVATVVAKLFNIIPADNAYFGQKDAQQAFIIQRMARDLNLPVKIKTLPIVRENDGLAMSSRNTYLTKSQRREAPVIYQALLLAKDLIKGGQRNTSVIKKKVKDMIAEKSSARIQYVSIVDADELRDVTRLQGRVLIAAAAYFGKTRLIDNIMITVT